MNNSNCNSLIFNEWCVPDEYIFALSYIVCSLPYLILWINVYKKHKDEIISVFEFFVLLLVTQITLFLYGVIVCFIGSILKNGFGDFLMGLFFGSYLVIEFSFFVTLFFFIVFIIFSKIVAFIKKYNS